MKRLMWIASISLIAFGSSFGQIRWLTTRDGNSSGNCKIQTNSLKVIVHPLHIDVEEEAEIKTLGSPWWGDSRTLEIVNEFSVSPGTAIRSLLLWNGEQILKGKLKLKDDADKEYEEVVDRQQVQQVPRDPALIEYISKDRYRCRIYPVAEGATRKIRVLYTIPLRIINGIPSFEISTLFTVGASETPSQIPVYIVKSNDVYTNYILKNNTSQKSITFGSVYIQYYSDIIKNVPNPWSPPISSILTIIPNTENWNNAWVSHSVSEMFKGYYTTIVASIPEAVSELLDQQINPTSVTLQAGITIGNKNYLTDISSGGHWSAYCKSDSLWSGIINWTAFDKKGNSKFTYTQTITPTSNKLIDSVLPLIWAMKYSIDEGNSNTGALFGFVDQSVSLLALESDTIGAEATALWKDEGVPVLQPEDIDIDSAKLPKTPTESIHFDFGSTATSSLLPAHTDFSVIFESNGLLRITFPVGGEKNLSIRLLDATGRVVYEWKSIKSNQQSFSAKLPGKLSGFYIVQLQMGNSTMQKKIFLR